LENPSEDALTEGSNGQLTYAGTQATLLQDLEQEIGHAVGFADNNNPNSILSYYLSISNQTLSDMDIAAAEALYGLNTGSGSTQIAPDDHFQQLAQVIAPPSTGLASLSSIGLTGFEPVQQQSPTLVAGHA